MLVGAATIPLSHQAFDLWEHHQHASSVSFKNDSTITKWEANMGFALADTVGYKPEYSIENQVRFPFRH